MKKSPIDSIVVGNRFIDNANIKVVGTEWPKLVGILTDSTNSILNLLEEKLD